MHSGELRSLYNLFSFPGHSGEGRSVIAENTLGRRSLGLTIKEQHLGTVLCCSAAVET